MKLKLIITAGILIAGASSCGESFFEQYPSNNITEGNYYQTDDDFNQGVVACYHKLKTQMAFHLHEVVPFSTVCSLIFSGVSSL